MYLLIIDCLLAVAARLPESNLQYSDQLLHDQQSSRIVRTNFVQATYTTSDLQTVVESGNEIPQMSQHLSKRPLDNAGKPMVDDKSYSRLVEMKLQDRYTKHGLKYMYAKFEFLRWGRSGGVMSGTLALRYCDLQGLVTKLTV